MLVLVTGANGQLGKSLNNLVLQRKLNHQFIFTTKEQLDLSNFNKVRSFIEKNKFVKGRRKQNQISMHLDLSLITNSNYEVRVFESKKLSQDEFDQIEEKNEVLPKYYKEFKTNFWEEF